MAGTPTTIGPYEILAELGRGGMGVVYRARDTRLNRDVALKVIAEAAGFADDGAARFRREAQAAAKLAGHPNIVGVHDIGEHEGTLYLAMQLIEGGTSLEDLVREGELTPIGAAELMAKIARAVHHAHSEGILHRDLKPANVLVTPGARPNALEPHVTDFGLARSHTPDAELTRLTTSGELLGTPAYMSPEQARGEAVDARTDVYALGATFYEMLAGRPPFEADSVTGTLLQALRDPPKPLRQVVPTAPRQLDAIVNKALEKEAGHRYASAAAFAEDLERFVRGDSIVARIPDPVTRAMRWARRRPITLAIGGLVVAGGAFGAGVWWSSSDRARSDTDQLTATVGERALEEQAAKLSAVYAGLMRATAPHLRVLEDRWHGLRTGDDPAPAALAAIATAVATAQTANPDLRLPEAWSALGQFFAGDEESALQRLAAARADAGDDPFPVICSAQVLFARYARTAELPSAGFNDGGVRLGAFRESTEMIAWRTEAVALLQPLAGAPIWQALTHGHEAQRFADAIDPFARQDWAVAAARLAPLLDDPLFGGVAGDLHALALYLALDLDGAAEAWAKLGERGWPHALRDSGLALVARADAIRVQGDDPVPALTRAGALLDRALALTPSDGHAHNARGIVHRVMGDTMESRGQSPLAHYEAAIASYTQVLARRPGAIDSQSNRGRIHRAIGDWVHARNGDPTPHYEAALADLDAALLRRPDYMTARRNRANCRKALARALQDRGGDPRAWLRKAIDDYDVTLAIAPKRRDPRNYISRGTAWRELAEEEFKRRGDPAPAFRRAEADITVWLKRDPSDGQAWYERGRVRMLKADWVARQGHDPSAVYESAFADFAETAKRRNNHAWAFHQAGKARRRFGIWHRDQTADLTAAAALFERSVQDQQRAVELNPRSLDFRISLSAARQTLGDVLQQTGGDGAAHYRLAIDDCSEVITRSKRHSTAWLNRGMIHWKLALALDGSRDYFQLAAVDLTERVRLRPRDTSSQYLLAKCWQKLDRVDEAIAALERTLALDPKHRFAPGRLKAVRARKAELDAQKQK